MQARCASTELAQAMKIVQPASGNSKFGNWYLPKFSHLEPHIWPVGSPWHYLLTRIKINEIGTETVDLLGSKDNRTSSFWGYFWMQARCASTESAQGMEIVQPAGEN